MKKLIITLICLFICIIGINFLFPKYNYDFYCLFNNQYEKLLPNESLFDVVNNDIPTFSFTIWSLGGNSKYYTLQPALYTEKKYKCLHIKKLGYYVNRKSKILLIDSYYTLPDKVDDSIGNPYVSWITNGNKYFTRKTISQDKNNPYSYLTKINPEKILTREEAGNTIKFYVEYQLDDDPIRIEELCYEIKKTKWRYVSPFYF